MTIRIRTGLLMLAIMLALAGCEDRGQAMQVASVDVPAEAESFAPRVFNVDGTISLSWLETDGEGHVLRYATWDGAAWNGAKTVARGDDWFANWADLPGVRPRADGGWLAWWLQKSAPDTYAYDIRLAFSDDGENWQERGSPHDDGTQTEHGFVTVHDLPGEHVGFAWLDGRNTGGGGHDHGAGGGMTLRHGILDAEGNVVEDAEFDDLTCDCCQTDSARSGNGVVMAYRDRSEDEIRDIKAARYENGAWSEPVAVHDDGWKIDGCPVNGPAVAADGKTVVVTWFTAPAGKGEVRAAWSHDGGATFDEPVRVDDGRGQGRVDVVMRPGGGAVVTWMEQAADGAQIRMRAISPDGGTSGSATLARTDAGRASGFPRMTVLDNGDLLLAWTDVRDGARRVRSARVSLEPAQGASESGTSPSS